MRERHAPSLCRFGVLAVLPILLTSASTGVVRAQTPTCNLNANPACAAAVDLGILSGDTGTPQLVRSGTGEAVFKLRFREDASSLKDLVARIVLQSPAGLNYDLVVRCTSCTSQVATQAGSGGVGGQDVISLKRTDSQFSENSFNVIVEVVYRVGTGCASWTLGVYGNVAPPAGATVLSCG